MPEPSRSNQQSSVTGVSFNVSSTILDNTTVGASNIPSTRSDGSTDYSTSMVYLEKMSSSDEEAASAAPKQSRGWRRIVYNISPSWFSVTMGTGIVAVLLHLMPFQAQWLHYLSIIVFILNIALFIIISLASIVRYTIYPDTWRVLIHDPVDSLFLGAVPIGFGTLIEMWIFICIPAWGDWTRILAFAAWIIDAVVAVFVTLMVFVMRVLDEHESHLQKVTSIQIIPIAATIVASAIGSKVAASLLDDQMALGALIASYIMWGMSMSMALLELVFYYQRLMIHKIPPKVGIASCFLPLGPLAMGGFCIMSLGNVSRTLLPRTTTLDPLAGQVFYIFGFLTALFLWAFAMVWLAFALAWIYSCKTFPFTMGWWGFTFPLGVVALSTIQMGLELPSLFFKVLGTIFSVAVILLWLVVVAGTIRGLISGSLFPASSSASSSSSSSDSANRKQDNHKTQQA